MTQDRPHLVTTVENKNLPVLIIDKKGFVGSALADKLMEQFLVVFVSAESGEAHKNIIHIPYRKKIPVIPDNSYSHIFVFYNGEEELLQMLPALMKKANSTAGRLFFLTALGNGSEALYRRLSQHNYHSMKVIVYGEIFDEETKLPNMVNYFIYQVRQSGRVVIPNEGLGKLYPIFLPDLLAVVIASAFSHEIKHGTLFVFPHSPFTEMSVARIIQKINPEAKIDFNRRRVRVQNYFIPLEGEYVFQKYDLEDGFKKVNLKRVSRGDSLPVRKIKATAVKRPFSLRRVLLGVVALLLAPLFLILASVFIGGAFLYLSIGEAEKGNFANAAQNARYGKAAFAVAETLGTNYIPAEIVASEIKYKYVQNLRAGRDAAGVGVSLFTSINTFVDIHNGKIKKDQEKEFYQAVSNTKNSLLKLEEMKAQKELPDSIDKKLSSVEYMLTLVENTIDTYPDVLGFNGKRKYLLAFQNNMELRPGGGFIGSFGLVDVDKGKTSKIEIHDVYDADGKLRTHIEPPFGLRRYAGVSHWFLRDSNFDIEFPNNAAAATDILARSTGDSVDGVIAIDTNFIKNVLEVLGSVTVTDYEETVTAENFYMLTQKHAEDNFFPGSTQKKDFLRALLNSMIKEITERKDISYPALLKAVEKSIKEKHILVAFSDSSIQKVASANNLSGVLGGSQKASVNSFSDFFATVDANIGANKGNYFLKREIAQNISILDGGVLVSTAIVNFENTSKKDSKFGGEYKNYLRFVLPEGASLSSVSIDGRQATIVGAIVNPAVFTESGFVAPQGLEVETTQADGREVVGFFMTVPIESKRRVAIAYTIPQRVDVNEPVFAYSLKVIKQPGTVEDPYTLTLSYPAKFMPINLAQGVVDLGGKVKYETKLTEDKDIKIEFIQK